MNERQAEARGTRPLSPYARKKADEAAGRRAPLELEKKKSPPPSPVPDGNVREVLVARVGPQSLAKWYIFLTDTQGRRIHLKRELLGVCFPHATVEIGMLMKLECGQNIHGLFAADVIELDPIE